MREEYAAAPGLAVSGLGCMRSGKVLFRELGFQLPQGQALILRGANGAGKSTLLRCLAGLLPWRVGQLHWCGQLASPSDEGYLQQLAYLGHHSGMNDAMTGLENLHFALRMMGAAWDECRIQQVLVHLALQDVAGRAFGKLSQGQRRRFGLARIVLSARKLWLLDEPDNSLDDEGSLLLTQMLMQHLQSGGVAVVVTHRELVLPTEHMQTLVLSPQRSEHALKVAQKVAAC